MWIFPTPPSLTPLLLFCPCMYVVVQSVGRNFQVERSDLQSEVGIDAAVPQLKIMKAIKTRFPDGV